MAIACRMLHRHVPLVTFGKGLEQHRVGLRERQPAMPAGQLEAQAHPVRSCEA